MDSRKRSSLVIAVGVAVVVLGLAVIVVVLRTGGDSTAQPAAASGPAPTPTVAVAPAAATQAQPTTPTLKVPDGKSAIALQLGAIAGGAGYVSAGDTVDIFATFKNGQPDSGLHPPFTKLVASNVPVLSVSGLTPGAGSGALTTMVAVDPAQAEQLIFLSTFESLYFAVVPKNLPPASTPGRGYPNAL